MNERGTVYMNRKPLVLYRNFSHQSLFDRMAGLLMEDGEKIPADAYDCAGQLVELAADYGFRGNLWHCFLALCLANHENAYSVSCEIRGDMGGTLSDLARQDFSTLKELFNQDITRLDGGCPGSSIWKDLASYVPSGSGSRIFNERVRDRIIELSVALGQASDVQEFQAAVTQFYREFGVGKYGLNKAFRIKEDGHEARIEPIVNVDHVYLDDIVGYESQIGRAHV